MQYDFLPSFLGKIISLDSINPTFFLIIYKIPQLKMLYIEGKQDIISN